MAGVVTDEMCLLAKGVTPTVPLEERLAIVDAIGIGIGAEQGRTCLCRTLFTALAGTAGAGSSGSWR